MSVTDVVRKLFWGSPATADGNAQKPNDRQAESSSVPGDSNIANTVCASKLQLIGLTRVRVALGPRWPELADRVRSVADTVIRKHVLHGDVYEPHGDDGFLVLFVDLSIEDARFKADAIAREIERRLIGSNLAEVAACSFDVAMIDLGGSSPAQSAAPQATKISAGAKENSEDRPSLRHDDADLYHTPLLAPWQTSDEPQHPNELMPAYVQPPETRPETHRAVPRATERISEPRKFLCKPSDIRWFYRPVWDFQNSALLLFALLPQRPDGSELVIGDDPLRSDDAEFVAELDIIAIQKAARDLTDLAKSARRLPLLVQVHHVSIADARRRAFFMGALKRIPAEYHKLLYVELVGFPQNYVTLGISTFAAELHTAHIRIAMRIDPRLAIPATLEACGAVLATVMFPAGTPEAEQMATLEDLAARALLARLDCGVWNIRTRSMAIAAASSGIRYLSGGAIAQASPRLTGAMRYSLDELFSIA